MRGGFNGARRCPRRLIYAAVFLGLLLWIALIVAAASIGGSSDEGRAAGGGGPDRSAGANARPNADSGGASDASADAGGEEPGYERVGRGEEVAADEAPQDGGGAPVGGQVKEERGTRLPQQQAPSGEPAYDPLGKNPGAGELSDTDAGRVRLAAFRFVDAAYDFEGAGPGARASYVEDVNWTVDSPEFWQDPQSPGGDALGSVARRTEQFGVKNRAAFQEFRVEDTSPDRVVGTAVFALDEGEGQKTYRQQLVLRRWAAVWRVLYAKQIEEAQ